jgi:phage tail sheath protein FI
MAEYLAPGVVIEEVQTNRPIEGVSTSTAGLVGATERGPLNTPQLVTSFGEFRRQFGELLPQAEFSDGGRCHGYLPHAVEGFFTNGGKRCYITRVAPEDATRAHTTLFHADPAVALRGGTVLLRSAALNSGSAASPPLLVALSGTHFTVGDWMRVGDGSSAEFHTLTASAAARLASLRGGLAAAHPAGAATLRHGTASDPALTALQLKADAAAGATQIAVTGGDVANLVVGAPALAAQRLLRIGAGLDMEAAYITTVALDGAGPDRLLTLSRPLQRARAAGLAMSCTPLAAAAATLEVAANAGDRVVYGPAGAAAGEVLVIERGAPTEELHVTGQLSSLPLAGPLSAAVPAATMAGAFTSVADERRVVELITDTRLPLNDLAAVMPGQTLTAAGATRSIIAVDALLGIVTLDAALPAVPAAGSGVTINPGGLARTVAAWPSTRVIPLAESVATVQAGMLLTAEPPGADSATVAAVWPDMGLVVLTTAYTGAIVAGTAVRIGGALYTPRALASADVVLLDRADGLSIGQPITVGADTRTVAAVNQALQAVRLQSPLGAMPAAGTAVLLAAPRLTAAAGAGAVTLALSSRLGLAAGDVLRIGTAPDTEWVSIARLLGERGSAPDAGMVQLAQPLSRTHANHTLVQRQTLTALGAARPPAALVLPAAAGARELWVSDGTAFATGDLLRLTLADGTPHFAPLSGPGTAAAPQAMTLSAALAGPHDAGATLAEREPLLQVWALDRGGWGNRLQVAARAEETGLVAGADVVAANPPPAPGMFSSVQLASLTGVEAGSVLELVLADGSAVTGAAWLQVRGVDRATRLVLLDAPGLQAAHINAVTTEAAAGRRARVRSREFSLAVTLLQRPSAAVPSRQGAVADQEVFRHLSMDMRHSRYVERVIGVSFDDGADVDHRGQPLRRSDRRSEGTSTLVRVLDSGATDAARTALRPAPELRMDRLPSGQTRAARQPLAGGDDAVAQMTDAMYLGIDSNEPTERTGLHSLKSVQMMSLVAVPGQVSLAVQQAVIDHCEQHRYRFAVLDGPPPMNDTVADALLHRSAFDTRYAAIYHPWLTIADPFPTSAASTPTLALPPSGHVLGLIARVDNDRGVHKAPANEVLRGIQGLARSFGKGEQEILNPAPAQINVIRDFRANSRGLRVWGARCITSDADYKYVNVRRLLIFLEDSIERGLQWVVFEPNADELWARVRRSVSSFLTTVWRNGALEGTHVEQAFFVRCDRTTMTRDDLDNGRLVCVIGVAPVKPAEFVIVRIGLWTADAQA